MLLIELLHVAATTAERRLYAQVDFRHEMRPITTDARYTGIVSLLVIALYATFLGWRLGLAQSSASLSSAFTAAFLLLCGLHAFLFAAALRLPLSLDKATEPLAEESPALLEMMSD